MKSKFPLSLFYYAAKHVPAYARFLKKHRVNSSRIRTMKDFSDIPTIDKKNYLKVYPFFDLLPKREMPPVVSVSSGSSGVPFYWPWGEMQETHGGELHETILKDIFRIGKARTLAIVCFSMGSWVAGTFTLASLRYVARKNKNLSIITPGIDKEDAIMILKNFAPQFEKIIITGYPPFVMDIVNEARNRSIRLRNTNLLFAGENFSENFRKQVHILGGVSNDLTGSVSLFGTADAGALAHETPLSIFVRKTAEKNKEFKKDLWGDTTFIPTFVQYNPKRIYFENVGDELVFTKNAGIPLVRYNIHDRGVLMSYREVVRLLRKHGYASSIRKSGFKKWKMPFLALLGRSDISITFYALNIYPENIKTALESRVLRRHVTGKFVAEQKMTKNGKQQKFLLFVELQRGVTPSKKLQNLAVKVVFETLTALNSEYRKLSRMIGRRAIPQVTLVPFGNPRFEIRKSKHKWVRIKA